MNKVQQILIEFFNEKMQNELPPKIQSLNAE